MYDFDDTIEFKKKIKVRKYPYANVYIKQQGNRVVAPLFKFIIFFYYYLYLV